LAKTDPSQRNADRGGFPWAKFKVFGIVGKLRNSATKCTKLIAKIS
jgi:hypothetical protein